MADFYDGGVDDELRLFFIGGSLRFLVFIGQGNDNLRTVTSWGQLPAADAGAHRVAVGVLLRLAAPAAAGGCREG